MGGKGRGFLLQACIKYKKKRTCLWSIHNQDIDVLSEQRSWVLLEPSWQLSSEKGRGEEGFKLNSVVIMHNNILAAIKNDEREGKGSKPYIGSL